jgi:hypothetical protein
MRAAPSLIVFPWFVEINFDVISAVSKRSRTLRPLKRNVRLCRATLILGLWACPQIGPETRYRQPRGDGRFGLPLDKPEVTWIPGNIDDGFWRGTPVGVRGSGTFSRTYRGDFARWHLTGSRPRDKSHRSLRGDLDLPDPPDNSADMRTEIEKVSQPPRT